MNAKRRCPRCEFKEGTDFMPIKTKKFSLSGSNKIYTFCLDCGEVISIRIEDPKKFVKSIKA